MMIRQIINTMTFKGKAFLTAAIVFFTFYGLSGAIMMILVLDMLRILTGPDIAHADLIPYWIGFVLLIVFKALCNVVADMAKHYAGFDIVEQLREKLILRLKKFSLGFYTKERLGEISTIIHKGVIRIGGTDIRALDYDDLLSRISIVMQNVILFADTIYNNIKLGKANASREAVMDAAQKAMIHDFIMTLPEGYETIVGENGVGLSGGQKQRISIARAFLKNAPIVILDEITSNVDPINEVKIQQAISNLARERTILVIAHHLRTIHTADMIYVFDQGSIVERGNHEQLLYQEGLYHRLWRIQEGTRDWKIGNDAESCFDDGKQIVAEGDCLAEVG